MMMGRNRNAGKPGAKNPGKTLKRIFAEVMSRYKFHCIRVTAVIAAAESSERAAITPLVETILCYGCYYLVIYSQGCFIALLVYCHDDCLHDCFILIR